MSHTLTLPSTRTIPRTHVDLVRDLPASRGTDPEFDRARQLLDIERAKAGPHMEAAVATADEITRLRERFLRDKTANLKKGGLPISQGVKSEPTNDLGFCAKLRAELNLHPQQADRLLDRADYVRRLRLAAAGKKVLYITGTGKAKREETFEPDAEAAIMAGSALEAVMAGDVPPSRAWAGITGEGKRRAQQGGDKKRKEPDPAKQLAAAFRSIQTWAPRFEKMSLEDQLFVAAIARDAGIPDALAPIVDAIAKLKTRTR